ncbi:MAG: C25 family cysteine peptidase, partial [bacterium]
PEVRARVRGKYEQAVYDVALRSVVENDNEISVYYQKPAIVEEEQLGSFAPFPVGPAIIIVPQEFHSAFQPYADWMTDQGIKTYLITPQTIYAYFSGVDNAEKVRNYIKYCYENAGGTYFILGSDNSRGHNNFVPVRWCVEYIYDEDTIIPTDLYFSDLTGNWDIDNDGRWGEWEDLPDRWPEVFVGRVSAYTSQEVTNWVAKALHYEKTPGVIFDSALWIYSTPVGTGNSPSVFPVHIGHIYAQDYWADAALNLMSRGYGIVNINCHGNAGDYRLRHNPNADHRSWWEETPNQYYAGLNWLTNVDEYFVGYSISCYVGAYDTLAHPIYYENGTDTCIADAYVDAYLYNHQGNQGPFGAFAFLANTRNGLWQGGGPSYDLQYAFWNRIMNPWWVGAPPEPSLMRIGVAEAFSKCDEIINWFAADGRYVCYGHTLFGSPSAEIWTKTPGTLNISHSRRIYVGQQTQFTVTVSDATTGRRLRYSKVCLNKPSDIYQVGSTNANGHVTFTIKPQSTGTLKVTVTRLHNADNNYTQYRPSQTICLVLIPPEGGEQSSESEKLIPTSLCITGLPTLVKGSLTINYGVPVQGDVQLAIYDATGSVVKSINRTHLKPEYYREIINTEDLSCGIYFVVLKQNNEKVSRKFLLIE